MKITIPNYRAEGRNSTTKKHYRYYMQARDEVYELMRAYVSQDDLRQLAKRGNGDIWPARVTITAYYKGKRHVDTSNLDDKIFVDGLMHVGIIKDDDAYHNPEVTKRVIPEAGKDEVEVDII